MTPSPSLSPLASLLLSLAHALAPKDDKFWIGDMRLEAPFVPNQFQFAFSALLLALKFRYAAIRQNRTATIAFASTALAALATLLFVPRLFGTPPTANGAMSAVTNSETYETTSEYLQEAAVERGISADAQETETTADTTAPQTTAPAEPLQGDAGIVAEVPTTEQATVPASPTDITSLESQMVEVAPTPNAAEPLAAVPPPAAITPAPSSEGATDIASATLGQEQMAALPAEASENATTLTESETDEATVGEAASGSSTTTPDTSSPASEASTQAKVAALPAPVTPSADTIVLSTQVRGDSVLLESTGEALLTVYRNSDFAGSPRIHHYLEAGETLTFGIPFSLYTNDASAIIVTVDGSSFPLSEESEEQFRVFTKP